MKKSHLKLTSSSAIRGIYLEYISEKLKLICAKGKMDFSNNTHWRTIFMERSAQEIFEPGRFTI